MKPEQNKLNYFFKQRDDLLNHKTFFTVTYLTITTPIRTIRRNSPQRLAFIMMIWSTASPGSQPSAVAGRPASNQTECGGQHSTARPRCITNISVSRAAVDTLPHEVLSGKL